MNQAARDAEDRFTVSDSGSKHQRIISHSVKNIDEAENSDEAENIDKAENTEIENLDDDNNENSEDETVRHFWNEKEQFKNLVKRKRLTEAYQNADENIITSDLEIEFINSFCGQDYLMELHI